MFLETAGPRAKHFDLTRVDVFHVVFGNVPHFVGLFLPIQNTGPVGHAALGSLKLVFIVIRSATCLNFKYCTHIRWNKQYQIGVVILI